MATPNKHISGKWTKEQREKAEKLLKSWTHQKKATSDNYRK